MWLFTTIGFFSVVADPAHADTLKVRARAREDLEALRDHYLPDLEVVESGRTDYRFRAFVHRDEWTHAPARSPPTSTTRTSRPRSVNARAMRGRSATSRCGRSCT